MSGIQNIYVAPIPGSYRISTDTEFYRLERYITKAIWPLTGSDGWKPVSPPTTYEDAASRKRHFEDASLSESQIWKPITTIPSHDENQTCTPNIDQPDPRRA